MNKVLLVDDEVFVRKGLRSLINWQEFGFEICWEADNGEDAFTIILEEKPDLVITDVRMPVVDGLTLIKKVREIENQTKFIIVSGFNDFSYAQQAVKYNVIDFVLKPIDQEELEETLGKLAKKLDLEKTEIVKQKKVTLDQTIAKLLEGNLGEDAMKECLDILNIGSDEVCYYLLIEVNNLKNVTEESSLEGFASIVREGAENINENKNEVLVHEHQDHTVGVLLPSTNLKRFKGDVTLYAVELKKHIAKKTDIDITFCIGKKAENITELKASYETANEIRSYKYILPNDQPITYEKVSDLVVNYNELDNKLYVSLMEEIEENNLEAIKLTIEEIFEQFRTKHFAPKSVKTSINRCIHGVIQTVTSMEGDETSLSKLKPMVYWEDSNLTLAELRKRFSSFIIEGASIIQTLRKENMKGDIYKIKAYIENNYHQNISLKSIANKFYMNPVYMGQLFKKTFGVYFKEFLLKIRIDEAKKLLRQTDMRVYEVADKVGFGSTDYFVTQFEKINKMTPTEYRNHLLNNSEEKNN